MKNPTQIPCPSCKSLLSKERWGIWTYKSNGENIPAFHWTCDNCSFSKILPEGKVPEKEKGNEETNDKTNSGNS